MIINPRRPLDNDDPDGYLESDRDFVLNNLEACTAWLATQTDEHVAQQSRDMVRVRVLEDAADAAERRNLNTHEISGVREAARYLRTRYKA